jgi:hypothetical protein
MRDGILLPSMRRRRPPRRTALITNWPLCHKSQQYSYNTVTSQQTTQMCVYLCRARHTACALLLQQQECGGGKNPTSFCLSALRSPRSAEVGLGSMSLPTILRMASHDSAAVAVVLAPAAAESSTTQKRPHPEAAAAAEAEKQPAVKADGAESAPVPAGPPPTKRRRRFGFCDAPDPLM